MKLIVVGSGEELTGFALAGAETVTCNAAGDAAATVDRVAAPESGAGLVLITPSIARHATGAVTAAQRRKGPPVVAVIPG